MFESVVRLFETSGFAPRNNTEEWSPALTWMHVGSDLFIWLAFLTVPLLLLYYTRQRARPHARLFAVIAVALLALGFGRLLAALTFHYPVYRLEGVWKVFTALASWAAVLALISVLPRVLRAADGAATRGGAGATGDTALHQLAATPARERVTDYAVAILAAVLALLVRAAIDPAVEDDQVFVLSLLAVVFVSWQSGFGPAMVTLLVSLVGLVYFFVPPQYSFVVGKFGDQLGLAFFFFCGVCCAGLGEAQRVARRGARAALAVALERKADLEVEVARRDEAEEAVRESEGRFRSMADSAPAMIWLSDLDRRRTYFNRTWLEFTGRTSEEEIGGGWAASIHPEDHDRYLAAYTGAFEARKPFELEYRLRRHDGAYRWVLARGTPRFTPSGGFAGFVGLCLDVTDRRRAEEELRRSEKNLADFFENANVGLHWVGPDGTVLRANKAELEILGCAREEFVGRNIAEFHDDPETIRDILERLSRGEELLNYPARLRRKDGDTRDVLISSTALVEDGKFVHSRCFTRDVTELRRSELAARDSEERRRLALDAAELGAWNIDPATSTLTSDERFQTIFAGAPRPISYEEAFALIHPEDRDRIRDAVAAATRPDDPAPYAAEYRVVHPDGSVHWVFAKGRASFADDGAGRRLVSFDGTVADVTDRKWAEVELRRSERRFRTLTEAIPQLVWNADAGGEVTYFNQRWQEYTGIPVENAAGHGWLAAVHPDDAERVRTAWQMTVLNAPRGADRFAHEFRLRRGSDDSYRWMLSVAVPFTRPDDTIDQWVGAIADIDDQKRAAENLERVVRQRTAELQTVNGVLVEEIEERKRVEQQVRSVAAELARSNGELEQFAYVASHDLQEPLRKIQAFGDRLATRVREQLPDTGREYVDRMLTSAGRMRRLIDDLLTFSRVTSQARPFSRVELGKLAREVASDLSVRVEETGGEVRIGEMPVIDADPSQLRQLMQNLIANALKFRRPDVPPVVEVTGELVSVPHGAGDVLADPERQRGDEENHLEAPPSSPARGEGSSSGTVCRIEVRDNGIGFDVKYLDRIFQVFQRLHGRDEYEGTGVGLAICRKIVERHGGTITATSRVGEGSTFVVTLPVRQLYPADAPVPEPER